MNNTITDEKLNSYLKITKEAFDAVDTAKKDESRQKEFLDMYDLAKRYYKDAFHFKEKGEIVMAFTAVNYAHAFLDALARLGIVKVSDSRLFMVDDGN